MARARAETVEPPEQQQVGRVLPLYLAPPLYLARPVGNSSWQRFCAFVCVLCLCFRVCFSVFFWVTGEKGGAPKWIFWSAPPAVEGKRARLRRAACKKRKLVQGEPRLAWCF